GTHPRRSIKKGEGSVDIPIHFAGVEFNPGHFVYVDEDGIIVAPSKL
ncbi:MAG: putative 4-hydroxy-4-methyl-2-oxoglutarate aldolase, partial [Calditrichota bacterium]